MRLSALLVRYRPALFRCPPLLLVCLLSQVLYAQTPAPSAQADAQAPLKVAITPSPFGYLDKQGHSRGIRPDLIRAATKLLDREVEFIHMPYLRAVHELKTGAIDITYGVESKGSLSLPTGVVTPTAAHSILPLSLYSVANRGIKIQQWSQTNEYSIGTVIPASVDQRPEYLAQGNIHYFQDSFGLTKALMAKRIDLVTLDPVSARIISKVLGAKLERIFDYGSLQKFPLFSPVSPRMHNAIALCQDFIAARIELFDSGVYKAVLTANEMDFVMPYYNQQEHATSCRISRP